MPGRPRISTDGVTQSAEELDRLQIDLASVEGQLLPPIFWINDCTSGCLISLMVGRGEVGELQACALGIVGEQVAQLLTRINTASEAAFDDHVDHRVIFYLGG